MNNIALSLLIIRGAIKGALISIIIAFIVLSVIGFLFGYGGPLLALYFSGWLFLYVAPIGMLLGAIVRSIRLFKNGAGQSPDKTKNAKPSIRTADLVWIGMPLLLVAALVIAPHLLTNVSRNVRHGATWTTEVSPECDTPAVILMLTEYAKYEVICSPVLLDHLRVRSEAVVPITYRVTYDFGEPRSYQLIRVGDVEITWSEWLGGPSGCGGKYTPACNSRQAQNGSPLYESSWSGN